MRSRSPRTCMLLLLVWVLAATAVACNGRRFPTESSEDPLPSSLDLSSEASSLPADGISTLAITAKIPPGTVTPTRKAKFRTSSGSFAGAATGATEIEVSFEPDGRAVAILRSSTTPGPVIVSAQVVEGTNVLTAVKQMQLEFVVPDAEGLRFTQAPGRAPADGASTSRFTVQVPASQPLNDRTVTFATTLGSFDGVSLKTTMINAGADGEATVLLYSPSDDGQGVLSASLSTLFRIETLVRFEPAPAESILVEFPAQVPINKTAAVKATLVRRTGTPTNGTVVTFEAFDQTRASFGSFHNVTLSTNGVATAEFRPGGTGTLGPCRIKVTAAGSSAEGRADFVLIAATP